MPFMKTPIFSSVGSIVTLKGHSDACHLTEKQIILLAQSYVTVRILDVKLSICIIFLKFMSYTGVFILKWFFPINALVEKQFQSEISDDTFFELWFYGFEVYICKTRTYVVN